MEETENVQIKEEQNRAEPTKYDISQHCSEGGKAREGTKNKKTLAKEEAWKAYEQSMVDALEKITKAQLMIACGSHMIFRIDTIYEGKKPIRKKPVRVTEEWEIEHFVDMYINDELTGEDSDTYYFATAIDPNASAISDILDRLNGKPRQTSEVKTTTKLVMTFDNSLEQIN